VVRNNAHLELHGAGIVLALDTARGLRATALVNELTGRTFNLGGLELEVDLDASDRRVWIEGWRCKVTGNWTGGEDGDAEAGYRGGAAAAGHDDSAWSCQETPCDAGPLEAGRCLWARTSVFLPQEAGGRPLALILGGIELYDFRFMRVFLNGRFVGTRQVGRRWNEPGHFDLSPGTAAAAHVRPGQPNVVALQLAGQIIRTARLDARDPLGARRFPVQTIWGPPFMQHFVVGHDVETPALAVCGVREDGDGSLCHVDLCSPDDGLAATVTYQLDPREPVIRKQVTITNRSERQRRIMQVRLGSYRTGVTVTEGGRGFPVHIDDEAFMSLADPSGWSMGQDGAVELRQYPGRMVGSGRHEAAMETVLGVSAAGGSRAAFVEHVRRRCRRVRRGHDRPYAIFEPFGSWDIATGSGQSWVEESEAILRQQLAKVEEAKTESGLAFDLFLVDFWVDRHGDLTQFDPQRFPQGFVPLLGEMRRIGIVPGLWIDSSMSGWHIGGNPAIIPTFTCNPAYPPKYWCDPFTCRGSEPVRTLFTTAFRHHVREHGVRLIKFDNLRSICHNVTHEHLPGIYSIEAIHGGVMEMLRGLDAECPDVFLMLYWGYRSPWWLEHADTLFEPGLDIEAATPGIRPTLYVRDGVTQGLDLAHKWCGEDLPWLGKDSLGVWLSDWFWNSQIGAERWVEGFIMDLGRGSLLAQPWSDRGFLDAAQRRQMADLIGLLRAHPQCFAKSRFVLGDPWREEPYGYCATDGGRAFVMIHNATWEDRTVALNLDSRWGLRDGGPWNLYRWHPQPAKLIDEGHASFGATVELCLRPFEVTLLEVVPDGVAPSLGRSFATQPVTRRFREPSRLLEVTVTEPPDARPLPLDLPDTGDAGAPQAAVRTLQVKTVAPACTVPALVVVSVEIYRNGRLVGRGDPGRYFAAKVMLDGVDVQAVPVVHSRSYPAAWQAWRMQLPGSAADRVVEAAITVAAEAGMELRCVAHLVPCG